ncbi:DNA-processing protein DprA [Bifidobacterium tibiigranuli]|uniref:DNA-processing protein DprA n=1 Tax=Bifidobacterium tibiigranuli TaxID=2172043 RepID=UPI003DAA24DA
MSTAVSDDTVALPSSQPRVSPPDAETLARATLTFCLDGADALMFALLKGAQNAQTVVALLREATSDMAQSSQPKSGPKAGPSKTNLSNTSMHAQRELEAMFATGIARWGRSVDHRGMQVFRRALHRWLNRFTQLPGHDPQLLSDWFTMDGSQWIIAPHSRYWPSQLADLSTRKDWAAPLCLWGHGEPSSLVACPKPIAIVGSRGVSEYGRSVAHDIALQAATDGHVVVSGGAFGTDAAAHWGALEASYRDDIGAGTTVAVFAGGLNHIGPQRNERLFEAILANSGALISELCPGTVPEARRFLLRNRIIAALSSTVVVAQARTRSGALNTANWAAELGREVYAVPGDIDSPNNAGCNALIRDGKAIILCSTHHIDELCHKRHERFAPEAEAPEPTESTKSAESSTSTDSAEPADRTDSLRSDSPHLEQATGNATSEESEEPRRYESVRTAIRRCRRRGMAANPEAILSMLTGDTTFAQLTETLGEMELLGMIEFHNGTIRIIKQSDNDSGDSCDAPAVPAMPIDNAPADKEKQS